MGEGPGVRSGFGEGISYLAEHFVGIGGLFVFGRAFRGYCWAFRIWPSISWVLVGFSRFAEHFVGFDGLFVFGRAFRRYWWAFRGYCWAFRGYCWAFRVWLRHFVGIGGHFVFGKQASPGNIMFDTPKHSTERVFW